MPSPPGDLFAALPRWTDADLFFTVAVAVGVVGFVVALIVRRLVYDLRDTRRLYAEEQAAREADALREKRAVESADEVYALSARARELRAEVERLRRLAEEFGSPSALDRRLGKTALRDGVLWAGGAADAPAFKPLAAGGRTMPIVSVLTLVGGEGKSTLTTYLAASLDAMGYRVLVVDMDLRAAVSRSLLPELSLAESRDALRLLPDFLHDSGEETFPNLLDYVVPVSASGRSGLVPTTEYLALAETSLAVRRLDGTGTTDVRFLLRRELHLARVAAEFDIVLIDCPPVLNAGCVNALAASDYLIVPASPNGVAMSRVPTLFARLAALRADVCPALRLMGVVANRTSSPELTEDEAARLSLLLARCGDLWGEAVPRFDAVVPHVAAYRLSEDATGEAFPKVGMHHHIRRLAREVEARLPAFCRRGGGATGITTASARGIRE